MSYYVPDGNWTSNVVNSLGNAAVDVLNFGVNIDVADPAVGCEKRFEATYKCGLSTTAKTVSIEKGADGKTARFDCAADSATCNDLKLTLTDDGKLVLTNTAGTKNLWDSEKAFGNNGKFPPNSEPIANALFAGNGEANSTVDVGPGGGPGRRYKYNYLLSGQMLETGQWIGSPTGTCMLMMGSKDAPNSLQVVKNILNCDSLDTNEPSARSTVPYKDLGCWVATYPQDLNHDPSMPYDNNPEACYQRAKSQGHTIFALQNSGACFIADKKQDPKKYGKPSGTSCPPGGGWYVNHVYEIDPNADADADAARLYTIPNTYSENKGKSGFVNNDGQLQLYPASMTSYNNNYQQIGNFQSKGGVAASFTGSSLKDCQDKCTTGTFPNGANDTQKCAGFIFDTTGAMCKILDNTMYTQKRLVSPTAQYFTREKGIINQDISCPADTINRSTKFWNDTKKNSTTMSPTSKCGLANFTAAQRTTVANNVPTVYSNIEYKDASDTLSEKINYDDVKADKTLYDKNKDTFKYWFESLQDKYNKLTTNLFTTKSSLKTSLNDLQESKQNLADWTGEQLQNLEAMNEDRDSNMMSQNYRHILWSILAIIIIIGTMKMTKANAA